MCAGRSKQEGISIRRRTLYEGGSDTPGCAASVFYKEALTAVSFVQLIPNGAGNNIGWTAGTIRHNDLDGFARPFSFLRICRNGENQHKCSNKYF